MMSLLKRICIIAAMSVVAFTTACVDNDLIKNDIGSTLQVQDGKRISTFYLPVSNACVNNMPMNVVIVLENNVIGMMEYVGRICEEKDRLKVELEIQANQTLDDGIYTLICYDTGNRSVILRYVVRIKSEMVSVIISEMIDYKYLEGSGTKDDPYIIANSDNFDQLLYNLKEIDSCLRGYGRYFKQTAPFDAPEAGGDADGRQHASFPFAGNYDGGGYAINNLNYYGSNDENIDVNIGLFDCLLDGAVVKNLEIDASIQGVSQSGGVLAGYTQGTVLVENVVVSGTINSCGSNCGGLIGISKDNLTLRDVVSDVNVLGKSTIESSAIGGLVGYLSNGTLTVNNFKLGGNIAADNRVGGVIGACNTTTTCNIDNVNVINPNFSIKGKKYVGGIIGEFAGSSFTINNTTLSHTVTNADSNLRTILAEGGEEAYAGGVIGAITQLTSDSYIKNTLIQCPIQGDNVAGGFIGCSQIASGSSVVNIENSSVSTLVVGAGKVGGFVGDFNTAGKLKLSGNCNFKIITEGVVNVEGGDCVGGMIGELSVADGIVFDTNASVYFNTNVIGVNNVGGLIGKLSNATLDVKNVTMGSDLMVKGEQYVGGLVGYASTAKVYGRNRLSLNGITTIPLFPSNPDFGGKIAVSGSSQGYFGGAVGYAYNTYLSQIAVRTDLNCSDKEYIGGIVGRIDTDKNYTSKTSDVSLSDYIVIENCYFDGMVNARKNVGGIAGIKCYEGKVQNCINYGTINASENVGGVLGKLDYNNISQGGNHVAYCVNTGNVTGTTDVGGVVGYMAGNNDINLYVAIEYSANYGKVSNSGSEGAGGILGRCNTRRGRVRHCANHGHVYTSSSARVGGVVGSMGHDGNTAESTNMEVGYCANKGLVESTNSDARVGGILGYQEEGRIDYADHDSWLHDCYNTGTIKSTSNNIGGILGKADNYSFIQLNFNYGQVNNGEGYCILGDRVSSVTQVYDDNNFYLKGTGVTHGAWIDEEMIDPEKLRNESEYGSFDFNNIWIMGPNHPILRSCPFQDVYL